MVSFSFITNAKIGFGAAWNVAYIVGTTFALVYCIGLILYGKKRAEKKVLA